MTLMVIAAGTPPVLAAAEVYPSRQIELVVAYPAGGGIDTLARMLAADLTGRLGQNVIVVNKPGAAGTIGSHYVAKARPDGHTLLLSGANAVLSPIVDGKTPFRISDFSPVARVTETPYVLAAGLGLPARSVPELVRYSHEHPGVVNYSSTGPGSVQHLLGAFLAKKTGSKWIHIPYQGGSQSISEVAAGRIHVTFSNPIPLGPYLRDGRLKVLGMATDKRIPMLPDVPTLEEQGIADFDIKTWVGVLAPAGTPVEVRQKLSKALVAVMAQPKIATSINEQGSLVSPMELDDFARFLAQDHARWVNIVKESGFTGD
ncbi:Bug family tripartite tricarboxylate transporter substrate binding protein [Pigmentiphaga kullae]|nr:tripartite tricarboxylate transporter substrate binding protein [Pigmentiphaga kullae]